MSNKIGFIPLDGRPCCLDFVLKLGTISGYKIQTPPLKLFRNFLKETSVTSLQEWLLESAPFLDYVILSIDMLAYGGFFASSRFWTNNQTALQRLEIISKLKSRYPRLKILAANVISRISWAVQEDEELKLSEMLVEYSQLEYLLQHNYQAVNTSRYKVLQNTIPDSYLHEYKSVRKRNHLINLAMIEQVKEGNLDFLVLAQADASASGPHREEQRQLLTQVYKNRLLDKVVLYSGADEVSQVLLARAIQEAEKTQVRFSPRFSTVNGPLITGGFEDLPLGKNLSSQIYAAGSIKTEDVGEADIHMFIHTPALSDHSDDFIREKACDDNKFLPEAAHIPWEFGASLEYAVGKRQLVALADVAFPNGCDKALMQLLLQKVSPLQLHAFAGWNTPGNTLGTVIAHSVLRWIYVHKKQQDHMGEKKHREFLFERFLDDYYYQSLFKPKMNSLLRERNIKFKLADSVYPGVNKQIQEKLKKQGEFLFQRYFKDKRLSPPLRHYKIDCIEQAEVYLPGERTFEVALNYLFGLKRE